MYSRHLHRLNPWDSYKPCRNNHPRSNPLNAIPHNCNLNFHYGDGNYPHICRLHSFNFPWGSRRRYWTRRSPRTRIFIKRSRTSSNQAHNTWIYNCNHLTNINHPNFPFYHPKNLSFYRKNARNISNLDCNYFNLPRKKGKIKAIIIFTLAGFLGIASMNLNISQPLLPLLTGLFGASTIINSIKSKTKIPLQKIEKIEITKKELIKPIIATILVSPICSFFPGLGSSQAAVTGSKITGDLNNEQFLILLSSINTLVMSVSFVTLFLIQKSRTGAAAAISQITQLNQNLFLIILTTTFITTLFAIPLTIQLSKLFAKNIHKIPYTKISSIILIFLVIIILIFSNFKGLLFFIVATILGLTCIEFQTRRSFLMGTILIPTILFYLPF